MKKPATQSATSLPAAPRDEVHDRMVRYSITMAVRTACFLAMLFIQPYGWWTFALAIGAIFLPYFAVVVANVGADSVVTRATSPDRVLGGAAAEEPVAATPEAPAAPVVLRVHESPAAARPTSKPDAAGEAAP